MFGWSVDYVFDYGLMIEVCYLGFVLLILILIMLVFGDVLVLVVLILWGFIYEDFGIFYLGGSLGWKLVIVEEVMWFFNFCCMV